ncbi:MAG: hypothetical protein ACD_79C00765G0005 [uncultured bacterium]|nr:MAG: hypothetical protein ACD_79C00765G0005 [uncultured bacterium]
MKKNQFIFLVLILFISSFCYSKGLLNERYALVTAGTYNSGDDFIKSLDDSIANYNLSTNLPFSDQADFVLNIDDTSFKGKFNNGTINGSRRLLEAGANFSFKPKQEFNPFVGVCAEYLESKGKLISETVWDHGREKTTGISFDFGFQYLMPYEVASKTTFKYFDVGFYDDFSINETLNYWFNKAVGIGAGFEYLVDSGDYKVFLGVTMDVDGSIL